MRYRGTIVSHVEVSDDQGQSWRMELFDDGLENTKKIPEHYESIFLFAFALGWGRGKPKFDERGNSWAGWVEANCIEQAWDRFVKGITPTIAAYDEHYERGYYPAKWLIDQYGFPRHALLDLPVLRCPAGREEFKGNNPQEIYLYVGLHHFRPGGVCDWPAPTFAEERRRRARVDAERIRLQTPVTAQSWEQLPEKLRKRVRRSPKSGCWNWQASLGQNGYGRQSWNGKSWPSHRLVYTLLCGEIPKGAIMRHRCDNRRCCNPDHLIPGTHLENRQDQGPRRMYRSGQRVKRRQTK